MTNECKNAVIIDAHVHIYAMFDVAKLLDSACKNFIDATKQRNILNFTGILLLSETSNENWHNQQSKILNSDASGNMLTYGEWNLSLLQNDTCTIRAIRSTGELIYIIAGKQIATKEGLEILALITTKTFKDGLPTQESLTQIQQSDDIAIMPWAVGKWLGKRGNIINKMLQDHKRPLFFLGDNSGRPSFWINPDHFKLAKKMSIQVIPGSDPLPITDEESRVGQFGFIARDILIESKPSEAIKNIFKNSISDIETYGKLESTYRFFKNQIMLRLNKK